MTNSTALPTSSLCAALKKSLTVLSATWTTCFAFSQNLEKSHIETKKLTIALEKCLDIIPWMVGTKLLLGC
jgi:hypothetical protein